MGSLGGFLFAYFLGGLTFIPLVLSLIFLSIYLTLPSAPTKPGGQHDQSQDPLRHPADDQYSLKSGTDELAEKFQRTHESDVAAGYFAVCREYVPGGVNGKPPERTTPAGEVIAAESPSVYQTMYRSLFDRKQIPTIDPSKGSGKGGKRARNMFYIVLRHGHLMLYDDMNQVEVRYVISLAHHDVSIYGGEGVIPEGELWMKRNAISLSRRLDSLADLGGPTPPFFLFSDNVSEKEDFYFAMLQNQTKIWDPAISPPKCQPFDPKHIVTLVQRLHSSEEQLQTRWVNAILGRLFLALYKTPEMEDFIRKKISKKISRANKPNLISRIGLQQIDMGEGAPFITNPRLKDLTVDGNCCVEADIQYTGNFRLVISATVRIDLGSHFKTRQVDIVLAVVLKKLEGHILLRFKPPPSNRVWISFDTMPYMLMNIEPIVSSKQITYGIILRTIESKIREMVAESLVQPFWDDIPFLETYSQAFRGGIWQREISRSDTEAEIPDESVGHAHTPEGSKEDSIHLLKVKDDRTMSMPALHEHHPATVTQRKGSKPSTVDMQNTWSASSSAVERSGTPSLPQSMRTQQFSNTADPIVTADNAKIGDARHDGPSAEKCNATSAMIEISSRSQLDSPDKTPASSPPTEGLFTIDGVPQSVSYSVAEPIETSKEPDGSPPQSRRSSNCIEYDASTHLQSAGGSSSASISSEKRRRHNTFESLAKSITSEEKGISLGTATAAAKKWGWNMFGRGEQNDQSSARLAGTPEQPIGRGHPLPPPGVPLPHPERFALNRSSLTAPRRKPVPPPLPERPGNVNKVYGPKPPLPIRKPVTNAEQKDDQMTELLVVEAPQDSTPSTPIDADMAEELPGGAGKTDHSCDISVEGHIDKTNSKHDDAQREHGLDALEYDNPYKENNGETRTDEQRVADSATETIEALSTNETAS